MFGLEKLTATPKTNETPDFEQGFVKVFKNRIEYKVMFNNRIIMLDQIADMQVGFAWSPNIDLVLVSGEKLQLMVGGKRKQELLDVIYSNRSSK